MNDFLLKMMITLLCEDNIAIAIKIQIMEEIISICEHYYTPDMKSLGDVFSFRVEFVIQLAKLLKLNNDLQTSLVNLLSTDKFKSMEAIITEIRNQVITTENIQNYITIINQTYTNIIIQEKSIGIRELLVQLDDKEFSSVNDMNQKFKSEIENLYLDIISAERNDQLTKSNFCDLSSSIDVDGLFNTMNDHYNKKDTFISTGFKKLDDLFGGGLEKTRLYVIGGEPGTGKSTVMLNMLNNFSRNSKDEGVFVYLTFENMLYETMVRLLCMNNKMTSYQVINQIKQNPNWGIDYIKKVSMNTILIYHPSHTITTSNILTILNKIETEKQTKIKGLIIDYLNLFKYTTNKELRHELTIICKSLKNIATMYNIPVLTATQLNKSSYGNIPTQKSIGESTAVPDNADGIILLQADENNLNMIIDKNRNGPKGYIQTIMQPYFKIDEIKAEISSINMEPDPNQGLLDLSTYTGNNTNQSPATFNW